MAGTQVVDGITRMFAEHCERQHHGSPMPECDVCELWAGIILVLILTGIGEQDAAGEEAQKRMAGFDVETVQAAIGAVAAERSA